MQIAYWLASMGCAHVAPALSRLQALLADVVKESWRQMRFKLLKTRPEVIHRVGQVPTLVALSSGDDLPVEGMAIELRSLGPGG